MTTATINQTTDLDYRALAAWALGSDTGISSETIATVTAGFRLSRPAHQTMPSDTGDIGRCIRLVRAVPGIRERLDALRAVTPLWAAIVDDWANLEAAYDEDAIASKSYQEEYARREQEILAGPAPNGLPSGMTLGEAWAKRETFDHTTHIAITDEMMARTATLNTEMIAKLPRFVLYRRLLVLREATGVVPAGSVDQYDNPPPPDESDYARSYWEDDEDDD